MGPRPQTVNGEWLANGGIVILLIDSICLYGWVLVYVDGSHIKCHFVYLAVRLQFHFWWNLPNFGYSGSFLMLFSICYTGVGKSRYSIDNCILYLLLPISVVWEFINFVKPFVWTKLWSNLMFSITQLPQNSLKEVNNILIDQCIYFVFHIKWLIIIWASTLRVGLILFMQFFSSSLSLSRE